MMINAGKLLSIGQLEEWMVQTMRQTAQIKPTRFLFLLLAAGVGFFLCRGTTLRAEDQKGEQNDGKRPVVFLTVESPLTDLQVGRVRNAALRLQTEAAGRNRQGLLFLEIQPGSSEFSEVWGLADWLTTKISHVTTVAWVPKTVVGNNVLLALACKEIVMAPEAELGDIGRGQPVEKNRQDLVLDIVAKSNNNKLSPALVRKMMDRSLELYRITLVKGNGQNTTESTAVVTGEELKNLQNQKLNIKNITPLLDAATVGILSGEAASRANVLVIQTASSLKDLAEAYKIHPSDLRENAAVAGDLKVRLIEIKGTIEPIKAAYVQRLINRAVADGANMIIFEVDSPGGYIESMWALSNAITYLTERKVRTVAYVPEQALSAAAVISLSCDEVYMKPGAKLGDAGPITIRPGEAFEHVEEKQLSPIRATLRALAEQKQRPAALLESMADRNLVVYEAENINDGRIWYMTEAEIHKSAGEWKQGDAVKGTETGVLLTVTGKEAHQLKLAEPPVADIDELKQRLGIPAETTLAPMEENWVDTLIFKLNTPQWTGTLFTIAMLCLFLELHLMSGVLAIITGLCFAPLLLGQIHGRHGGLVGSHFIPGRHALPGIGTLRAAGLRRVRHFRRADGAGFADSRQPNLRRCLEFRRRYGPPRHHGQNAHGFAGGRGRHCGGHQPLSAAHSAV